MIPPSLIVELHTTGEPLRVKMSQSFWTKVGKAITTDIRRNIIKQKQADGSPLQVNKESTQKRKRAAGRPLRSLIDVERRLVRAGAFVATVLRNGVSVVPEATDISRWVQEGGDVSAGRSGGTIMGDRNKYTGWFGVSARGVAAIEALIAKEMRRLIAKASKKKTKKRLG